MKKLLSVLIVLSLLLISAKPKPASALESIEIQSVSHPVIVAPQQTFCFSITVKVNDGQLLESRGDMLRNSDGNLFGHWPHIAVAGTVNSGQTYTFNCYGNGLTAPSAEGTYESKWRIWRAGGWVGPEAVIRFEVRNEGDGGGGDGGGSTVQCPSGLVSPALQDGFLHRSAPLNQNEIVEYAASVTVKYCDSEVDVAIDDDSFELESAGGSVAVDHEFNLTSADLTVGKSNLHLIAGVLTDNTDYPGLPYYGEAFTNTVYPPSRYFSVESEHEVRHIRQYYRPNYEYNFAYLPSVRTYVVEALANARFTLQQPQYLTFLGVMAAWFAAIVGGLILLAHPSSLPTLPAEPLQFSRPPASLEATALFEQRYGQMVHWANISGLTSERDVISAYTEFSVTGSGFSPNGQVYYQFGLPGQEPVLTNVVVADSNGNVDFDIAMPAPALVPLGNYLLAAFDHYTINQTMEDAFRENLEPSRFSAGVVAIEVVEDVTPPTIVITSPAPTSYSRCDQPDLSFEVTDDLSGVAQVTALLDGAPVQHGTLPDMLLWDLGTHTVDIQAFDRVGLEQNEHLEFQLVATIKGLQCALVRFQTTTWLKTNGTFVSLDALLSAADRALAMNKPDIARQHLLAASRVLSAQKKMIDWRAYSILVMDVNALIEEPQR